MDKKPPFSGTVKEYTEERYIFDNKGKETLDFKYIWKYNDDNRISEIHHYNSKNKLTDVSYYKYDNFQNILEIIVKTARGNKKQRLIYEYIDNKLSQVINTAKSFRTIEKFDDCGNLIEEVFYRDANSPPYVRSYKNLYDKNKRIIEKQTILPSGEIDSTVRYKYNDKGLLIEENRINNKTSLFINGRELRSSKNSVSKHTYNHKGDLILSEYYSDGFGSETHKKEITYNEFNDIAQIKDYRKGYAYIWKDNFGLLSITKYFYVR